MYNLLCALYLLYFKFDIMLIYTSINLDNVVFLLDKKKTTIYYF